MRTLIILCAVGALAGCTYPQNDTRALTATGTTATTGDCYQIAQSRTAGVPPQALGEAFRAEYNACKSGQAAPPISYR